MANQWVISSTVHTNTYTPISKLANLTPYLTGKMILDMVKKISVTISFLIWALRSLLLLSLFELLDILVDLWLSKMIDHQDKVAVI